MEHYEICFYLDENLSPEIIVQLRRSGIDAIRGPLSDDDTVHLKRATEQGRVICTQDKNFNRIAKRIDNHSVIIKGRNRIHKIGDWVKFLRFVHATATPSDMRNKITYLFPVD